MYSKWIEAGFLLFVVIQIGKECSKAPFSYFGEMDVFYVVYSTYFEVLHFVTHHDHRFIVIHSLNLVILI